MRGMRSSSGDAPDVSNSSRSSREENSGWITT
jgi:hypothetical protein